MVTRSLFFLLLASSHPLDGDANRFLIWPFYWSARPTFATGYETQACDQR
jgi:hypothetical protein